VADTSAPQLLSVADVAKVIGRSTVATRRIIERGQIPARKLGGRVVVLREELAGFLQSLPLRGDPGDDGPEAA